MNDNGGTPFFLFPQLDNKTRKSLILLEEKNSPDNQALKFESLGQEISFISLNWAIDFVFDFKYSLAANHIFPLK